MKMNMNEWLRTAAQQHKAMPVLSFPGVQIINATVDQMVNSSDLQAQCMKAIAQRYDTLAAVSLMDLSVEAEAFGSPVRYSDDDVPTVTGAIIDTEEDLAALRVPAVGEKRTGTCIDGIRKVCEMITDRPVLAGVIGPFSLAGRLMDMTEIMVKCYVEPELVAKTLDKVTDFLIAYIKSFRDAGAQGVVMAEPAAGLLSPELITQFSSPYVKKIIDAVSTDEFLVVYHNCGKTIPLIDSILSTGTKALHFGNTITLSEMLPLIPSDRLVFGNVDPAGQFRNGTPESVQEATLDVINACKAYPNFIISSGCDIPPVTPLENIDAFFDTVDAFYRA